MEKEDIVLTTGKFAKMAGVSERTIRYYDKIGLLKPSLVKQNGYRYYQSSEFVKLQKILTLKYLGFPLNEIHTILLEENHSSMQDSLSMQISLLDKKIAHMRLLRDALEETKETLKKGSIDWDAFARMIRLNQEDEKILDHYRNNSHLSIRIRLHEMYSTNPLKWFPWLYEQMNFHPRSRILEVGCGDGTFWKCCGNQKQKDYEIFLSDISQGMVDSAKKHLQGNYNYLSFDIQNIPFQNQYFDVVIANHVLFYVNDLHKGLQEICRVLKNDGVLYCSTYGMHHMKEISEIAQEFDSRIILSDYALSNVFGLENGERILKQYFEQVELRNYKDELCVDSAKPIFDYIMSCHGNQNEILQGKLDAFQHFIMHKVNENQYMKITKDAGIFICHKPKRS